MFTPISVIVLTISSLSLGVFPSGQKGCLSQHISYFNFVFVLGVVGKITTKKYIRKNLPRLKLFYYYKNYKNLFIYRYEKKNFLIIMLETKQF